MEKTQVYNYLIDSYKVSIERTRRVFVVLNVITIIFLVGLFNHKFTWLRHLNHGQLFESLDRGSDENCNPIDTLSLDSLRIIHNGENIIRGFDRDSNYTRPEFYLKFYNPGNPNDPIIDIRKNLIEDHLWSDFKFLNINLFGTKIFIDDLPIVGGIALIIVLTWFFYVMRRERGVAFEVKRIVESEQDINSIQLLFYGTAFNEIFNKIRNIDRVSYLDNLLLYTRRLLLFGPSILILFIILFDYHETHCEKNLILFPSMEEFTLKEYLAENKMTEQVSEIGIRLTVSIILLIVGILQTINIILINRELGDFINAIEDKYHKLVEPSLIGAKGINEKEATKDDKSNDDEKNSAPNNA